MRAATTFKEILDQRGRILLFTPNAIVGLRFEQAAERASTPVIHTRGWADVYGPLALWHRIHASREVGLLSCDQHRYVMEVKREIPATDVVWVGAMGHPLNEPMLWLRFSTAMGKAGHSPEVRLWTCAEGAA